MTSEHESLLKEINALLNYGVVLGNSIDEDNMYITHSIKALNNSKKELNEVKNKLSELFSENRMLNLIEFCKTGRYPE